MNTKSVLTLLAFIACCLLGTAWYKKNVVCKTCEETAAIKTITPPQATVAYPPYYFKGKNGKVINFSNSFPAFKDSLQSNLAAGEKLLIKGYWYATEDTTGIGDLGMIRANQLKDTLSKIIPAAQISCLSVFINQPIDTNLYRGAALEQLIQPKLGTDSTTSVLNNGRLIVYFPSNSTKNIFDDQTKKNIASIIQIANTNPSKAILIIGHTDAQGNANKNVVLSENRANKLRYLLIKRGLPSAQIKTEGKGQAEPIASNDTEEGKALNRRAEVIFQ
jgi:OmpA-OmpF porin, OOP family